MCAMTDLEKKLQYNHLKMKNKFFKKGLSDVVVTLLTIVLVLSIMAIIWSVTSGLIQNQMNTAEKCGNIVNKININSQDTCYDKVIPLNPTDDTLQLSIEVKNIDLDGILITINEQGKGKSFKITKVPEETFITQYGTGGSGVVPLKNEMMTYIVDLQDLGLSGTTKPSSVKIAPIVGGEQCDTVDSLLEIDYCPPSS